MAGIYLNETTKIDTLSAFIRMTGSDVIRGISWGIPAGELVGLGSFLVQAIPSHNVPTLAMVSNSVISGALSTIVISGLASVPSIVSDCHRYYMDANDGTSAVIKLVGAGGTFALGYLAKKGMVPIITNIVVAMFESITEVGFVTERELITRGRTPLDEGSWKFNMRSVPMLGDRIGVAYPRDEHGQTSLSLQDTVPASILFLFRHNQLIAAAATRLYARLNIVNTRLSPGVGKIENKFKLSLGEQVMVFVITWGSGVIIGYVLDFTFGRVVVGKSEHKNVIIDTFNQTISKDIKIPVDPRWDPNVGSEFVGVKDEKVTSGTLIDTWFIIGVASYASIMGLAIYYLPEEIQPIADTPDVSETISNGLALARGVVDLDRSREILQNTAEVILEQIGEAPILTMISPILSRGHNTRSHIIK